MAGNPLSLLQANDEGFEGLGVVPSAPPTKLERAWTNCYGHDNEQNPVARRWGFVTAYWC